ncbi:hypothetical protein IMZ38_01630 [Thermosphaera chiliense]|uniref:Uncharacterized protein n=1 Tax=Thermosphaera chiliense TaxID=3402707 RepID=A0A7M1UTT5_9CREN|nr:hypothetical protein [Thermosphaera aggregans]QOR94662.1 hypothetical protein IMZ38_01630 [Thermosphaera aggregans]
MIKWEWIVEWVKQIRWEWIATTMFFYVWVSILISDDEMSKTTELEKMPETSVVCPKCYAMGVRFVVHEVMDRNELMRYSVAYCPNCGFTVITDEKAEYVRHIKNGSREQAKELAKRIREYREFAQKLNLDELVEKLKKTPETSVDCPKCYAMGVRFVVHEVMDRNELMRYSVAYCPNCGFTVITDEKAEYVRHIKNGSREQAKELAKRIREYFQHIRCGEIEMRLNLEELVEELKKMHGTLVACPMCGRPGVKYDVYAETYLGKPISYLVAYCPNCGFTVITDEEAEYICHIKNGSREQAIKLAKRIREYFQHIDNLFEEKMK